MQTRFFLPHLTPEDFKQVLKDIKEGKVRGDKRYQYIVKAIEAHPELVGYLEKEGDILPQTEPDPFLHLMLHVVVEELLDKNEPPEISHFYTCQQAHGASHHDIVHMLGGILTTQLWMIVKEKKYDYDLYRKMLREYAAYPPEVFWQRIKEEEEVE